jgi:hypothetical protein
VAGVVTGPTLRLRCTCGYRPALADVTVVPEPGYNPDGAPSVRDVVGEDGPEVRLRVDDRGAFAMQLLPFGESVAYVLRCARDVGRGRPGRGVATCGRSWPLTHEQVAAAWWKLHKAGLIGVVQLPLDRVV